MMPEQVVSGARDSSIRVWDLRSGKSLFGLFGYTVYLGSVQYNRTVLISDGTNNVVSMYDFAEGSDYIQDSEDDFHFDDLDC
jgi:WD40 repeat protein